MTCLQGECSYRRAEEEEDAEQEEEEEEEEEEEGEEEKQEEEEEVEEEEEEEKEEEEKEEDKEEDKDKAKEEGEEEEEIQRRSSACSQHPPCLKLEVLQRGPTAPRLTQILELVAQITLDTRETLVVGAQVEIGRKV